MPIKRYTGAANDRLILLLYRGQFQLATDDAFYSDGDRYRPAIAAARELRQFLPGAKTALVLGAGLGSVVYVLRKKGCHPTFTLVEKDKVVLQTAMELFSAVSPQPAIEPVCADAQAFMAGNTAKYDFLFLDVFNGRVVPPFVTTSEFLAQCRAAIAPGGHLAFNYMINDAREWEKVKLVFTGVFPGYKEIDLGINRVLVV